MVNISEEELRRFVKANAHRSETITRGKNFKVFKNYRLYGEVVNVISFHDRHFAVEEITCKKVRYIEMNDYLLSIPSLSGMENYLFFLGGACYNTQDGTRTYTGKVIADSCYVGRFVVIDGRMLALCDKKHPRFFIIVVGQLREIPSFTAEQILRNMPLSARHLEALRNFCAENWEIHNGIMIKPDTLEVPGSLQYYAWKRSRSTKAVIKANLDFGKLLSILTRDEQKETPAVKFVSSEHF